jgi:GT2 family glycosyltransferase
MKKIDYAITFACYNQVEYTKQCIDSMIKHGVDLSRVVVVDNNSSDGTRDYLDTLPLGGKIYNKTNLGCGVAWNQGALALQAKWTIVMNNDILVSENWIENLIQAAEKNNVKMISPAMIEGDLDYDFEDFVSETGVKMAGTIRPDGWHAVCVAIHDSVWQEIGYFQSVPLLLGYEDTLFLHEVLKANIPCAFTGDSWIHHYGSMTQKLMRQERGLSPKSDLPNRRLCLKYLRMNFFRRKLHKMAKNKREKLQCGKEVQQHGMSMFGTRVNGQFVWR